MKVFK
jgi:hypothetical protein